MRAIVLTVLLGTTLAGCAPAHMTRAIEYSNSGNCNAAFREVINNESDPGLKAGLIGAIFIECKNDRATAIKYFTLSARYGIEGGRNGLMRLGAPVPYADLQSASSSSLDLLNAAVSGWNAGTAASRNNTVNCTSRRTPYGNVETECR